MFYCEIKRFSRLSLKFIGSLSLSSLSLWYYLLLILTHLQHRFYALVWRLFERYYSHVVHLFHYQVWQETWTSDPSIQSQDNQVLCSKHKGVHETRPTATIRITAPAVLWTACCPHPSLPYTLAIPLCHSFLECSLAWYGMTKAGPLFKKAGSTQCY